MDYSIPQQANQLLLQGIIENELINRHAPGDIGDYAKRVRFEGDDKPSIPINWRFAESVSALKGFEAAMVMALVKRKYGVDVEEVVINSDHAQLFIMSCLIHKISSPEGANTRKYFPDNDIYRKSATLYRRSCTNMYQTEDKRFFHLHGSLNPGPSLESVGLPQDMECASWEESWKPFMDKVSKIKSSDLQHTTSDVYKQAGTIAWSREEYQASDHYKANAHVGLYEVRRHQSSTQPPCWWPEAPHTSAERPLGGLKVVDICRVIAAPAITRGLAELGASVMRVTAPHLPDYDNLHCDLNWGKWNCSLDFRKEDDRERLRDLIRDADVVVTGYRPHCLDKWGFGEEDILKLCKDRDRGVIYVRENCYGWNGPWAYRTGWQQISDACCGVSLEFGRAMGNDEPVTPVFPNSDYCTGIAGVCGVVQALLLRSEAGGSYTVDSALNYYSQWLVNSCGMYPTGVWEALWASYDKPVFRHYHHMPVSIPRMLRMLEERSADVLFKSEFFEEREARNKGITIRTVKPILRFTKHEVEPRYQVGTRPNGVDKPLWPKDLMTETVV